MIKEEHEFQKRKIQEADQSGYDESETGETIICVGKHMAKSNLRTKNCFVISIQILLHHDC